MRTIVVKCGHSVHPGHTSAFESTFHCPGRPYSLNQHTFVSTPFRLARTIEVSMLLSYTQPHAIFDCSDIVPCRGHMIFGHRISSYFPAIGVTSCKLPRGTYHHRRIGPRPRRCLDSPRRNPGRDFFFACLTLQFRRLLWAWDKNLWSHFFGDCTSPGVSAASGQAYSAILIPGPCFHYLFFLVLCHSTLSVCRICQEREGPSARELPLCILVIPPPSLFAMSLSINLFGVGCLHSRH